MTLDQLVHAAGIVGIHVSFDKLGRKYVGWLMKNETNVTAIVGADTCDEAVNTLAVRFDRWLREFTPERYEQALKVLDLAPPGRSIWERLLQSQWGTGEQISVETVEATIERGKTRWLLPPSPLVGLEESPGVFSVPASAVYTEPGIDGAATISRILHRAEDRCERPSFGEYESSEVCGEARPCPHHEPNGRLPIGEVSALTGRLIW